MRYAKFGFLLASLLLTCHAQTPPPPGGPPPKPARGPSLKVALELAQGAIDACAAKGYAISVTVADQAGNAKVTLAADGSPGRTSTSLRKAASAAIFQASGAEIAVREKTDPALAAKIAGGPTLYSDHAGSLPLRAGTVVIGGIGIAGSPSHEQDAACAQAALDRYGSELK